MREKQPNGEKVEIKYVGEQRLPEGMPPEHERGIVEGLTNNRGPEMGYGGYAYKDSKPQE